MKFKRLGPNAIARYEPFTGEIYLIIDNKLRVLRKDTNSFKKLLGVLDFIEWKNNFYSVPKNVQIQITKVCNFKCTFCYANSIKSSNPNNYMSLKHLCSVLDKLYDNGVLNVQYVGGETFMHKNFIDVISYAKSLGLSQSLITNGIIPGLHIDKYSSIIKLFSKIQVSVNSTDDQYNEMVGVKIYDKLKIALKNIASTNKNVWISFVVTRNNSSKIPKIMELAKSTNCVGVRFGLLAKQGKSSNENYDYFSCLKIASKKIKETQKIHPNIKTECHFDSTLNTYKHCSTDYSEGKTMLFINLNGDIYPFPLLELPEMKLGNIFEDDFLQIWENNPLLNKFRNKKAINPICDNCLTPCTLRSPTISYIWGNRIGAKIPCARFNYEK